MNSKINNTAIHKKNLSVLDVWSIAFGCMVGWGTFVMPGTTFLPVAGPAGTVIAISVGAVLMLVVGNNLSFLMQHSNGEGGIYSYTKEAFGRDHAFLSSWFLCLSYLTIVFLNGTALFLVLRTLLGDTMQAGFYYTVAGNDIYIGEVLISVTALASVGILFIAAKSFLNKLQTALAIFLAVGVLVIIAACIPHAISSGAVWSFGSRNSNTAYGIVSIVFLVPWAFVGFDVVSYDTVYFKFPVKRSKPIVFTAIILAGIAYAFMAVVGVAAVPDRYAGWGEYIADLDHLSQVEAVPTFYAAREIMGQAGLVLIGITALAAVLTGIIGGYRAIIRVLSAMAEDRILSGHFSKTKYSILFIVTICITLAFLGRNTLGWFVDLTSFGAIVGFGYTSAAAYKFAKSESNKAVQLTGVAGTVVSVIFVIVQLVPRLTALETMGSEAFLLLSFWCLLGFVFYLITITRNSSTEYSGMSTSGVVLFALLLYSAFMWLAKLLVSKTTLEEVHHTLLIGGSGLIVIIFIGLGAMIHIQNVVRRKHELSEREKIRAMEGSLAKSQFLFNMSHDIRTPMNAIIGYTNLALKEPASPQLHEYLAKINRSNKHLLTLINDILEMSRIESGKVELEPIPADLYSIFDGIYELFEEQMKKKQMDFKIHTSQIKHRYVWCDVKNFNRIIANLLGNAYKFTPDGGTVSVTVLETADSKNGCGSFEIRITDSGIGMSREFVEIMFNPFERERTSTDSGIEGTGLGLSITKNLVDLMGGTIDVHTAPGSGTEFVLRLKLMLAEESDLPREEEPNGENTEEAVDFSGRCALVVEDNMINLEIAQMILKEYGFTVETAENGKIALEMVTASPVGHYDVIFMDIQMPVMDGLTSAAAIRKLDRPDADTIPIIALTANAFDEDVKRSLQAGMNAHLSKPVDNASLLEVLKASVTPGGKLPHP